MFEGAHTAIVTPFKDDTSIDWEGLERLIEFQIANGAGLVPCGTTGENPTLSEAEHMEVVSFTVDKVAGRARVIAGAGSNATSTAIMLTQHAQKAGADGALVITPYYNKPTQDGLYAHFKAVAESADIPIVMYNVPSRCGVNMLPPTVARLTELPTIVAVKEATGSVAQACEVMHLCDIEVISGEDAIVLPLMSAGGKGVISVVANIAPKAMADMCTHALEGQFAEAQALHRKLYPLSEAMFFETNPTPAKTALEMMGKIGATLRLPLVPMTDAGKSRLREEMVRFGLLD